MGCPEHHMAKSVHRKRGPVGRGLGSSPADDSLAGLESYQAPAPIHQEGVRYPALSSFFNSSFNFNLLSSSPSTEPSGVACVDVDD